MCCVVTFCARRAVGRKSIADVRRADAIARAGFLEDEDTRQQTLRTVQAKLDTTTPLENDSLLRSVFLGLRRDYHSPLATTYLSCYRPAGLGTEQLSHVNRVGGPRGGWQSISTDNGPHNRTGRDFLLLGKSLGGNGMNPMVREATERRQMPSEGSSG